MLANGSVFDFNTVLTALNAYTNEEQVIRANLNLSDAGKQMQLKTLADKKSGYRPQAAQTLLAAHASLLKRMDANQARRQAALNKAEETWDFERLNYYSRSASSQIAAAGDLVEIAELYNQVVKSGNTHNQRAWCEIGMEKIDSLALGNIGVAGGLLGRMKGDLAKLLMPPEMAAIDKTGAGLVEEAQALRTAAQACIGIYGGWSFGSVSVAVDSTFTDITEAINITSAILPDGRWKVSASVVPLEQVRSARYRAMPSSDETVVVTGV